MIHFPSELHAAGDLNGTSELNRTVSGAASLTALTKNSWIPSRSPAHTTRVPSGDQTGVSLRPLPVESGEAPPRARSTSQRLDSDGDIDFDMTARMPSGEIVTVS